MHTHGLTGRRYRGGRSISCLAAAGVLVLGSIAPAAGPPAGPLKKCPIDAVVSGSTCVDKYEASVWRVPDAAGLNKDLVTKIQQGKATAADLVAGGATQVGVSYNDYAPCGLSGQNCVNDIYAVSLPGVAPSWSSWFQAQAACGNARKRLPSNAEWQAAAAGTPDAGPDNGTSDCNTDSGGAPTSTGSRSACVSARGAFDMVGNLEEWAADWVPVGTASCPGWPGLSDDIMCLPGVIALLRGGNFRDGMGAGPFAVVGGRPDEVDDEFGFRCVR